MARLGVSTETVSKVMNHAQPGITGRVYVRYRFDAEVKAALETRGPPPRKAVEPGGACGTKCSVTLVL
jgi:hypothetical protein